MTPPGLAAALGKAREMSVGADSFGFVSERWGREQVLGLAPDASSSKAAAGVAKPAKWGGAGCDEQAVWGECQGSGSSVYRACVDLSEPAFRCSCPSRKFPCKHALGLLLLWSDGVVPAGAQPGWADEWLTQRQEKSQKVQERREAARAENAVSGTAKEGLTKKDPKTAERRERRVDDGIDDLDRWLCDQIAHGLAQAEHAPYALWDDAARRLVDAQAGALAGQIKSLAAIPRHQGGGAGWPERLLEEYALLRLLTRAYQRRAELPEPLQETVRARVGFTMSQEEVLSGPTTRDRWYVTGIRDTEQDRLITRRVWLRGLRAGRPALVLSFAAPGRALDASLLVGTALDADLAFYPGAQPLRALIGTRHAAPAPAAPPGSTVGDFLREYARALALDPWLDRWPAVLENVRLSRDRHLVDEHGDALPLDATDPWRLLAASGGGPMTIAGEWSPRGLRALSAWHDEEGVFFL
ncbi:MAG: zinc finger domain protein [Actinomycetia bacterium]|nr:zinc finger domain protein [Actinomycetes bacterium]